jgi:hypothetical protein
MSNVPNVIVIHIRRVQVRRTRLGFCLPFIDKSIDSLDVVHDYTNVGRKDQEKPYYAQRSYNVETDESICVAS